MYIHSNIINLNHILNLNFVVIGVASKNFFNTNNWTNPTITTRQEYAMDQVSIMLTIDSNLAVSLGVWN